MKLDNPSLFWIFGQQIKADFYWGKSYGPDLMTHILASQKAMINVLNEISVFSIVEKVDRLRGKPTRISKFHRKSYIK